MRSDSTRYWVRSDSQRLPDGTTGDRARRLAEERRMIAREDRHGVWWLDPPNGSGGDYVLPIPRGRYAGKRVADLETVSLEWLAGCVVGHKAYNELPVEVREEIEHECRRELVRRQPDNDPPAAVVASPDPPAEASPIVLALEETDAMRRIAEALGNLPESAAERVVRWATEHWWPEAPSG